MRPRVPVAEVFDAMTRLDLRTDSVTIVHSSLVRLQVTRADLADLVDGLRRTLGDESTLVFPTFTFGESKVWDYWETPSQMGLLTEAVRQRPDAVRSVNPLHSVAAIGPMAAELCDQVFPSSFGPDSLFDRLVQIDAQNISIGTDFEGSASFLHVAEDRARVPYREDVKLSGQVVDRDGQPVDAEFWYFGRGPCLKGGSHTNDWGLAWDDLRSAGLLDVNERDGVMLTRSDMAPTIEHLSELLGLDPFRYCGCCDSNP